AEGGTEPRRRHGVDDSAHNRPTLVPAGREGGADYAVSASAIAAQIGSPVSSSIQAHWPFGLRSRKYHSPAGVTAKSIAANRRPSRRSSRLTGARAGAGAP